MSSVISVVAGVFELSHSSLFPLPSLGSSPSAASRAVWSVAATNQELCLSHVTRRADAGAWRVWAETSVTGVVTVTTALMSEAAQVVTFSPAAAC